MSYKKSIITIMTLVVLILLTMSTTIQAASVGKVYGLEANMEDSSHIILTWDSVSNAKRYNVYVNDELKGSVTKNGVSFIGFSENTTYRFKIAAVDSYGREGTISNEYRFTTTIEETLGKVTDLKVSQVNGSVTLNWSKVNNATKYQVFLDTPNFGNTIIGEVKTAGVIINGCADGVRYGFSVRACKTTSTGNTKYGEISNSKYITVDYDINHNYDDDYDNTDVGTVKNVYAYNITETTAEVDWSKNPNADGYEVLLSENNGRFKTVDYVTNSYTTLKNLKQNTYYEVKVVAYKWINGQKKYGEQSSYDSFTTKKEEVKNPGKVYNLSITDVTKNSAYASWSKVSDASGYNIYVSEDYGSFKYWAWTTNTNYKLKNLDPNTYYQVKVEAYKNVSGQEYVGDKSSSKGFTTKKEEVKNPGKVYNLSITDVTKNSAYASWSKVSDASGYNIYVSEDYENFKYWGWTTDTEYKLRNLDSNTYYQVKVEAYKNVSGQEYVGDKSSSKGFTTKKSSSSSDSSDVETTTKLGIVTHLTVQVKNVNEAYLYWWAVDGADGYEIVLSKNGASYKYQQDVQGLCNTILMSEELDYNTNYKVKVRAYKYDRYGDKVYSSYYSEPASFKTEKYNKTQNSEKVGKITDIYYPVIGNTVYLDWNYVSGAEGYEIDFGVPGIGNTKLLASTNGRPVSGVTGEYYYTARIRAYKTINGTTYYGPWSTQVRFKEN